jgi:hypothetical protein
MSRRTAAWFAWSLCALSLTLTALSLLISALNLSHLDTHVYDYWLENAVLAVSFSIIGAIIASRLPGNSLGWLYCAAACIIAVAYLSAEYAIYALLARPDSLPAGEALAWLASWVWLLSIGCIVLSLLLFPNGRLPSSSWSGLAWLSVLLTTAGAVWVALSPGAIGNLGSIRNPLGIEALPDGYKPVQTIMSHEKPYSRFCINPERRADRACLLESVGESRGRGSRRSAHTPGDIESSDFAPL